MSFLLDILSGVLANTISDTSYIPITQGTLCLSVIRDLFDLSIVAYKTSTRQSIKLVLDTIRTAIEKKRSLQSCYSTVTKAFNMLLKAILP